MIATWFTSVKLPSHYSLPVSHLSDQNGGEKVGRKRSVGGPRIAHFQSPDNDLPPPPPPHSPSIAYIFLLTLVWRRVRHEELDDESILTMTPITMATFRFDARSNAFATAPPPTSRSNSQNRNFLLFFSTTFSQEISICLPARILSIKIAINPFISNVIKLTCVN